MKTTHPTFVFATLAVASLILGLAIFSFPEFDDLRNHGGDALATACLFSGLALFLKRTWTIALITLAVTVGLELLQIFTLFEHHNVFTDLFLGHHFDPIDLGVYIVTTIALARLHLFLGHDVISG